MQNREQQAAVGQSSGDDEAGRRYRKPELTRLGRIEPVLLGSPPPPPDAPPPDPGF